MSWSKRHYPIVPRGGTALAGLAALVALSPLTLVTPQAAGAATVNYHAAATLTQRLRRAGVLRRGDGYRVQARLHAQ
jgi:hypothetical protein